MSCVTFVYPQQNWESGHNLNAAYALPTLPTDLGIAVLGTWKPIVFHWGWNCSCEIDSNIAKLQLGLMIMTKVKKIRFSLRFLMSVFTIVALSSVIFFQRSKITELRQIALVKSNEQKVIERLSEYPNVTVYFDDEVRRNRIGVFEADIRLVRRNVRKAISAYIIGPWNDDIIQLINSLETIEQIIVPSEYSIDEIAGEFKNDIEIVYPGTSYDSASIYQVSSGVAKRIR